MIECVGTGREIEIDWVEVECRQEMQKECIHLESLNRLTAPDWNRADVVCGFEAARDRFRFGHARQSLRLSLN